MDSTKGECYWRCLHETVYDLREYREFTTFLMRQGSTDGDGAVAKSERRFRSIDRLPNLHITDIMHRVTGFRTKCTALIPGTTTHMIALGKSYNFGASMAAVRRAIRDEFKEFYRYRKGVPSEKHARRQRAVMDLFISDANETGKLRAAIYGTLFTGDLDGVYYEHVCPGCCSGEEDGFFKMVSYGTQAFAGTVLGILNSDSWEGQEHPLNWAGLMECTNRLITYAKSSPLYPSEGDCARVGNPETRCILARCCKTRCCTHSANDS